MTGNSPIIVLFDGVCNVCNGAVQFIIRRDAAGVFRFASLQSVYGQQQLQRFGLTDTGLQSMLVIQGDRYYRQSDAIIEITRHLPGLWPLLQAGKIVPRPLRDLLYRLFANHRYRLFGKRDHCMIPTPALRERFLE